MNKHVSTPASTPAPLPVLAPTLVTPGIGPEVVARAVCDPEVQRTCRPLVIGDAAVLRRVAAVWA